MTVNYKVINVNVNHCVVKLVCVVCCCCTPNILYFKNETLNFQLQRYEFYFKLQNYLYIIFKMLWLGLWLYKSPGPLME